jgi:choice-of-anchor C domain-containing protein
MPLRSSSALAGLMCACGALAVSVPVQAAPFTNGSFEVGPPVSASTGYVNVVPADSSITGWTVLPANIDYVGSLWMAEDGVRSLDLSGGAAGGVEQTFDTFQGSTYVVRFFLAGNGACGSIVKGMDVVATGNAAVHYTFDTTGHSPTSMGWQQQEYDFVATGTSTTLAFQSTENSVCGPALDNVSVIDLRPVPALPPFARGAAALLLLLLGLRLLARRAFVQGVP